jgi:hypothetical protein
LPDIFDEVSEDLRADRARALLRRYGGLAIALAVLVVVATGVWELWRTQRERAEAAAAERYLAAEKQAASAVPAEKAHAAAEFQQLAAGAPGGYAVLASLQLAALRAAQGDTKGAIAAYDAIAADGGAPRALRDLASLRAVQAQVATGDPATLRSRLATIEVPESPWHGEALETDALIALAHQDTKAAIATLKRLSSDVTASAEVRGRANGLLQSLGVTVAGGEG